MGSVCLENAVGSREEGAGQWREGPPGWSRHLIRVPALSCEAGQEGRHGRDGV